MSLTTPFGPLQYWIKVLQPFGGLPLKSSQNATYFSGSFVLLIFVLLQVLSLPISFYLQSESQLITNDTLALTFGPEMEIITFWSEMPKVLVFLYVTFVVFRSGPKWNELFHQSEAIKDLLTRRDSLRNASRKAKIMGIFLFSISFICALCGTWPLIEQNLQIPALAKFFLVILEFVSQNFLLTSPLNLTLHILIYQGIGFMDVMVKTLTNVIKENTLKIGHIAYLSQNVKTKEIEKVGQISKWIVLKSNKLIHFLKTFTKAFEVFIFSECAICLYEAVGSIFNAVSIFNRGREENQIEDVFLGLQPLIYLTRLFFLMEMGELLSLSVMNLEQNLREFSVEVYDYVTDETLNALKASIKYWIEMERPIRPMNGFYLSLENYLSSMAMLITFCIILVQFKAADLSCGNQEYFNATIGIFENLTDY